jgi:hypothetical protein
MIISPTKKFIFFKPMKTAGSSVEFALALSCGPDDIITGGTEEERKAGHTHQNNFVINEKTGLYTINFHAHTTPGIAKKRFKSNDWKIIETYDWITMVRNPWDALVSYYWWVCSQHPDKNKHLIINKKDSKKEAVEKFSKMCFSFATDIPGVEHESSYDNCCAYQYIKKYNTACADPRIDHYIRYEHLEQDFENVADALGLYNVELPRFKTTQKKKKEHYSYYYSETTKNLVHSAFKDYIKKFDYKFEHKSTKLSRRDRSKRRKDKKV